MRWLEKFESCQRWLQQSFWWLDWNFELRHYEISKRRIFFYSHASLKVTFTHAICLFNNHIPQASQNHNRKRKHRNDEFAARSRINSRLVFLHTLFFCRHKHLFSSRLQRPQQHQQQQHERKKLLRQFIGMSVIAGNVDDRWQTTCFYVRTPR
jgi:hypothetical protein